MHTRLLRRLVAPAFFASLAVLVLIECLIRITMVDFFSGRYQYGFDTQSGFVETADGRVNFVRAGGRRFYPQSMTRAKAPGTFRVITVGDSIARGASLEEAYPAQFGKRLRDQGYHIESINLAVPGFGSTRQLLVLRRALEYHPDLVILHFGMSNEFEDERDEKRAAAARGTHPRDWPLKSYLIARLHEYKIDLVTPRLLPEKIRVMSALDDAEEEASANRDPVRVQGWLRRFSSIFDRSLAALAEAGVPVLLIPRVELRDESPDTRLDDAGLARLLEHHLGARVRWLDLRAVFGEHPAIELFSRDRVHLHPPAHQVLGDALAVLIGQWSREPGSTIAQALARSAAPARTQPRQEPPAIDQSNEKR